MQRDLFHFDLPAELIAQAPAPRRRDARLLVLDPVTGALADRRIPDLVDLVAPGDLLVFNDTRVIPARLHGRKASGGRVEILVERVTGEREVLAHVRASKSPKPGSTIHVGDDTVFDVAARENDLFRLVVAAGPPVAAVLAAYGEVPLPPYIEHVPTAEDRERYQTVYARAPGAVAAPTAGLHFDEALLASLREHGCEFGYVTLHVGAGTFQPVRVDDIGAHRMHAETVTLSETLCEQVRRTRERGHRVVAIGTTSVRALESGARTDGTLQPQQGETDIFIYPGYEFRVVDALLTNFHLPESTLLMLVSAFAGRENVLSAYAHAVRERYRFFSYGDAMWIPRRLPAPAR